MTFKFYSPFRGRGRGHLCLYFMRESWISQFFLIYSCESSCNKLRNLKYSVSLRPVNLPSQMFPRIGRRISSGKAKIASLKSGALKMK